MCFKRFQPHQLPDHIKTGKKGELLASKLLREKGYTIILKNYQSSQGEIDLIAVDGSTLCFVEVKTRTRETYNRPSDGLSKEQKERIVNAGTYYVAKLGRPKITYRFDLIEVVLDRWKLTEIRHWPNAILTKNKSETRHYRAL